MLQKEFEIGFPLRHPGIRETYAYVQMDTLGNCIEMEWIDGVTLNEFLASGALDESSFRRLAAELCDALAYLHFCTATSSHPTYSSPTRGILRKS